MWRDKRARPLGERESKIYSWQNLIEICLKNPIVQTKSPSEQNSLRYNYTYLKLQNTPKYFELLNCFFTQDHLFLPKAWFLTSRHIWWLTRLIIPTFLECNSNFSVGALILHVPSANPVDLIFFIFNRREPYFWNATRKFVDCEIMLRKKFGIIENLGFRILQNLLIFYLSAPHVFHSIYPTQNQSYIISMSENLTQI